MITVASAKHSQKHYCGIDRQTTNAHLSSYDIAQCGWGGGHIGDFIQVGITELVGGAVIFLVVGLLSQAGLAISVFGVAGRLIIGWRLRSRTDDDAPPSSPA